MLEFETLAIFFADAVFSPFPTRRIEKGVGQLNVF